MIFLYDFAKIRKTKKFILSHKMRFYKVSQSATSDWFCADGSHMLFVYDDVVFVYVYTGKLNLHMI